MQSGEVLIKYLFDIIKSSLEKRKEKQFYSFTVLWYLWSSQSQHKPENADAQMFKLISMLLKKDFFSLCRTLGKLRESFDNGNIRGWTNSEDKLLTYVPRVFFLFCQYRRRKETVKRLKVSQNINKAGCSSSCYFKIVF